MVEGTVLTGEPRSLDATTTVLQVSGSQDWNLIHHDREFAIASGHCDILYNTSWTAATLAKVLTDWAGPDGWLLRLEFQMRKTNGPGDRIQSRAKVTRQYVDSGDHYVDFDVWIENDRSGITTTGTATVRLP